MYFLSKMLYLTELFYVSYKFVPLSVDIKVGRPRLETCSILDTVSFEQRKSLTYSEKRCMIMKRYSNSMEGGS